ncbi:MAG: signal peptidase II [Polyangiaceae bacterium]
MSDPPRPDSEDADAAVAGGGAAKPAPVDLGELPADSLAAVALDGEFAPPPSAVGPAPASEPTPPPSPELPEATQDSSPDAIAALRARPSYVFFGVLAALSLILDIGSKAWAEVELSKRTLDSPSIVMVPDHLMFTLAYNRGGAWGLLHDASENVRRPFFLAVSVLAIAFIVSLYSRLAPGQRALKWGLPMVLGGALGNLSDRIIRSSVVDFIDYRANWIEAMNRGIARVSKGWAITDHWPTFNVADIFICIGVGLMAVDMITSRRKPEKKLAAVIDAPASPAAEAPVDVAAAEGGAPGEAPPVDAAAAEAGAPGEAPAVVEPGDAAASSATNDSQAAGADAAADASAGDLEPGEGEAGAEETATTAEREESEAPA